MASTSSKPKWLIVGGMGFIGRNFVKYLVDNGLASDIRVADKRMPFMAFLSADHKAAIESEVVEVMQADASDEEFVDKMLDEPRSGGSWDYIVNCAGEMDHSKAESFHAKAVDIASKLATAAVGLGSVKKFIQLSTATVYASNGKTPATESAKVEPWTTQAAFMLRAEEAVKAVPGLPYVILRPAVVYGPGDVNGIMPRAVCAAAYWVMKDKMEFLWEPELALNTVHVFDVARAIYFAARKLEAGSTWNLADKGATDQKRVSTHLGAIFGIETGFYGSMMSNLAKLKMDSVVDQANETHLAPWLAMLKQYKISVTPLSPYLHKQLLQHNHLNIDGSAIEAAGFKYAVPECTMEGVRDSIVAHMVQGIFPPILPGVAGPAAAGAGA